VLAALRRRRADVVAALAVDPQSRTTVDALVDAVLDARFAVQGTTLTFEVWLPEGLALDSLLPMVARALPRLAAGF
jgi:hypothetical protein